METTLQHALETSFRKSEKVPLTSRFFYWCEGQEQYRFGWLAAALSIHGCALTPITLFAIILSGVNIFFFVTALVAMGIALVTNLAAMPTKVTIPAFLFSVFIDVTIIISCVVAGFDIAGKL